MGSPPLAVASSAMLAGGSSYPAYVWGVVVMGLMIISTQASFFARVAVAGRSAEQNQALVVLKLVLLVLKDVECVWLRCVVLGGSAVPIRSCDERRCLVGRLSGATTQPQQASGTNSS
jgi:hypothetical protein